MTTVTTTVLASNHLALKKDRAVGGIRVRARHLDSDKVTEAFLSLVGADGNPMSGIYTITVDLTGAEKAVPDLGKVFHAHVEVKP